MLHLVPAVLLVPGGEVKLVDAQNLLTKLGQPEVGTCE